MACLRRALDLERYGTDVNVIAGSTTSDKWFGVASAVCMFIFFSELCLASYCKPRYLGGPLRSQRSRVACASAPDPSPRPAALAQPTPARDALARLALTTSAPSPPHAAGIYFWLDVVATFSLLSDIPQLTNALKGAKLDGGAAARAGRASRAGTRVGRIVRILRIIRMTRLIRLFRRMRGQAEALEDKLVKTKKDTDDTEKARAAALRRRLAPPCARTTFLPARSAHGSAGGLAHAPYDTLRGLCGGCVRATVLPQRAIATRVLVCVAHQAGAISARLSEFTTGTVICGLCLCRKHRVASHSHHVTAHAQLLFHGCWVDL